MTDDGLMLFLFEAYASVYRPHVMPRAHLHTPAVKIRGIHATLTENLG